MKNATEKLLERHQDIIDRWYAEWLQREKDRIDGWWIKKKNGLDQQLKQEG